MSIGISAAPEKIWPVVVDVEHWPQWTEPMSRLERLDGGAFAAGSLTRVKQPKLPALVWRVIELTPHADGGGSAQAPLRTGLTAPRSRSGGPGRNSLPAVRSPMLTVGLRIGH
ncbi:MAG: hypothetical protein AUI14_10270 [Actinobacteria bacterium 13_2_20CM_2_71_6]|nr:MAG: hypothetical protein AUI14_10270 [Actinobacteria bacterium 13_2_20CM_2_71_6]